MTLAAALLLGPGAAVLALALVAGFLALVAETLGLVAGDLELDLLELEFDRATAALEDLRPSAGADAAEKPAPPDPDLISGIPGHRRRDNRPPAPPPTPVDWIRFP